MSFSDTQSAKRYAAIAEVAAAQAKIYAQELEEAPNYAAEAAASAEAAANSSSSASQYAGNAAEAANSASSSASAAAASAASAAGAAQSAISQTVRAPQGESLSQLPAAASRQNQYIATDSAGNVTIVPRSSIPVLDSNGKLPVSTIPAIALTQPFVVSNQAAMLALDAQPGDIAKRTDLGYSFCLAASPASTLSNWIQLTDDVLAQLGLSSGATQVGATSLTGASSTVQAELSKKPDSVNLAASNGALAIGFNDTDSGVSATTVSAGLLSRMTKSALLAGTGSLVGYQYASDSILRNIHDRFAETLSIMDYVQSTDGGDYSLALQRIFTKYASADSFHIKFPTGYFQFKTQAVYNGSAVVSIEGCQGTKWSLEWNSAQANIAITSQRRIFIDKIEIEAKEVIGQTKIGVYLNCTTQDYSHNLTQIIATATISSANTGIIMFDIVNFSLGNVSCCYVRYFGVGSTTHNIDEFSNNIGWRITATTKISTDSRFENCGVVGCETAFAAFPPNGTSGYLEGIAWMRCTVVDCLYGLFVQGDNTQVYRSPMYVWLGGHIFAYKACISHYWVSQIIIQAAILYLVYDATHSGSFGNSPILLNECVNTQIDNVTIRLVNQIVGPAISQAVYVGSHCAVTSVTNLIVYTASQSKGVVSVPGSKYTTAFNVKVYYSGTAPTAAIALGGTSDEDLGGNSVRAA